MRVIMSKERPAPVLGRRSPVTDDNNPYETDCCIPEAFLTTSI